MQQEHYGPLRAQLAELYAGRRLAGEPGLTPAGLRLLRRVLNLEALSAPPGPAACCDWAAVTRELDAALAQALRRRRGWLRMECQPIEMPVALPPAQAGQLVLNLIWLLARTSPARLRLSLSAGGGAAQLRLSARGGLYGGAPYSCGPDSSLSALSDRQLALAAPQALARRAGGILLLYTAPGGPGAYCRLPLCKGQPLAPIPAQDQLRDRFSPLHILLDGMTVPPDL